MPSFRLRVLLALALLVTAAQVANTGAVLYATDHSALEQAGERLTIGGRVLEEQLATRTRYLQVSVQALLADFGFRQAAASNDLPTVLSLMLERARVRAGAAIVLVPSLEGRLRASTSILADRDQPFPFPNLLATAEQQGSAAGVVVLDGRLWQVVMVPVLSPKPATWVSMGFLVDDTLARELQALTGIEVSFRIADPAANGQLLASTLSQPEREASALALAAKPPDDRRRPSLLGATGYLAVERKLTVADGSPASVVLQSSVARAHDEFAGLRLQLVLLSAGALLLAAILAVIIARSVARPVRELAAAAQRVAAGDYAAVVEVSGGDELAQLAGTFNSMLGDIARREARIIHQARHDPLTDLPNRALARERLEGMLERARPGALLMLDLEQFRSINETLDYRSGDRVLERVARRLRARVRPSDTVARVGGDEFLVLLDDRDAISAMRDAAVLVAALRAPLELDGAALCLRVSVGIAFYPAHGDDAEALMRRVDEAMHAARDTSDGVCVYEPGQDECHLRRLRLVRDLRHAGARGEFELHYQPKLDLRDGTVNQVEALVRWNHPEYGFLPPDEFIGLAEQSGNVRLVTRWVLAETLRQMSEWQRRGMQIDAAVNLSALDLQDQQLPQRVQRCLATHDLPAGRLTLEITESAVMLERERALEVLERLRAVGVVLAIDDFGVGYSSLAQLRRLPVRELKIDRSFVQQMGDDDEVIVRSTIELGHNMSLKVVAEGVETRACLERLRAIGCDAVQGYLLSRPLPAAALERWYATSAWSTGLIPSDLARLRAPAD